jgi:hypothetical protein
MPAFLRPHQEDQRRHCENLGLLTRAHAASLTTYMRRGDEPSPCRSRPRASPTRRPKVPSCSY